MTAFSAGTLTQTYSGTQKSVATTTTPLSLTVNVSFSTPTNAGSYRSPPPSAIQLHRQRRAARSSSAESRAYRTWAAPAAITYGAALSGAQLNASANVLFLEPSCTREPLAPVRSRHPEPHGHLHAHRHYRLRLRASQRIANREQGVVYDHLGVSVADHHRDRTSSTQLDASASIPGTFVYSPTTGTVLAAAPRIFAVTFTPTDPALHQRPANLLARS